MKYIILSGINATELMERVNAWIEKGYDPIGGMTTTSDLPRTHYQAMIKSND